MRLCLLVTSHSRLVTSFMRIALGVSGGIAAYKAAELVRLLQDQGLDVQVVMTRSACEFITPLTFAALSGHKVITEMFGGAQGSSNVESAIEHIAVAQSIDALVIAPATANVLAKIAHGIADDFLTTLCLATKAPLIVAPAMNVNMWEHAATQQNLETLRKRGVRVVDPDEGYLACGMTGAGRLASPECIAKTVFETLGLRDDLKGEVVLVTAGPTRNLSMRSATSATGRAEKWVTLSPRPAAAEARAWCWSAGPRTRSLPLSTPSSGFARHRRCRKRCPATPMPPLSS